jgi:hypothetical protein
MGTVNDDFGKQGIESCSVLVPAYGKTSSAWLSLDGEQHFAHLSRPLPQLMRENVLRMWKIARG